MRKTILRNKIFRPLEPIDPDVYVAQRIERAFPGGEWVEEPPVGAETPTINATEDAGSEGLGSAPTYPYVFGWGNNEKRAKLKGKRCRVISAGTKNSVLVEFEDGTSEIVSRRALKDTPPPAPPSTSTALTIIGDTKGTERVLEKLNELEPLEVIVGRLPSGRGAESKVAKALEDVGWAITYVETTEDVFGSKAPDVNVEAVLTHDIRSPILLLGNGSRVKQARSWLARANWPREVIECA